MSVVKKNYSLTFAAQFKKLEKLTMPTVQQMVRTGRELIKMKSKSHNLQLILANIQAIITVKLV